MKADTSYQYDHRSAPTLFDAAAGDALSVVLDTLSFHSSFSVDWAPSASSGYAFVRTEPMFHAVREGRCWLRVGRGEFIPLEQGDVVVFPNGATHDLAGAPNAPLITLERPPAAASNGHGQAAVCGDAGSITRLTSGGFSLPAGPTHPLQAALPEVIRSEGEGGHFAAVIEETIEMMRHASRDRRCGASSLLNLLAQLLFVGVVREYVAGNQPDSTMDLNGILDPEIGPILAMIHGAPGQPWSVASLAEKACMSRSFFCRRFKAVVGLAPMECVTDLRMRMAGELLMQADAGLKEIASRIGYESASSFSTAFKRWSGVAPSKYRKTSTCTSAEA